MSLGYKRNYCANCGRDQSGLASGGQVFLMVLLTLMYILPGIIYYFCATPSRCHICGLKKKHKQIKTEVKEDK